MKVKITFEGDSVMDSNGLYAVANVGGLASIVFEVGSNLYSRLKHKDEVTAEMVLDEVAKIIEEEGIDVNKL